MNYNRAKSSIKKMLWLAAFLISIPAMVTGAVANWPKINISCFAFRDINRNGLYDLSDRPYSGLRFRLSQEELSRIAFSNVAGFGNFVLSGGNPDADISEPGSYVVEAIAPRGYKITTNNSRQAFKVRALDGSPGGLIIDTTLVPIGVAPELTISGSVDPYDSVGLRIVLEDSEGAAQEVYLDTDGFFSVPVTSGDWLIKFIGKDFPFMQRDVTVGSYPVLLGRIARREIEVGFSRETKVISFDDLTVSDTLHKIPNGYNGLEWTNWIASHQKLYNGPGYINGTHSGEFIAYSSSGHPASIQSDGGFDFVRSLVSVAWPKAERFDVRVRTWRGKEVYREYRFRASRFGPVDFQPDYQDITRIEFSSAGYWQVVLDDVEIRMD